MFAGLAIHSTTLVWGTLPFLLLCLLIFRWAIVRSVVEEQKKWRYVTLESALACFGAIAFALYKVANLLSCFMGMPGSVMGLAVLAVGIKIREAPCPNCSG